MIRLGMVGFGKMGLSHLATVRAHPLINVVAGCDDTAYLRDVLSKYTGLKCYGDYDEMLDKEELDAVLIATPSRLHAPMAAKAIDRGLHVFCEKPFVLDVGQGERLVSAATSQKLTTQVGYHYRFVGSFREAARIVQSGALGDVHHVRVEAYGPVVLRPSGSTWRSAKTEGGGALYDYACHAIDLVNYIAGVPESVSGVVRRSVFSRDVDDEVYGTLHFASGVSGQLCVNWSDESFRKMSTKVSVWGTNGRVSADRQECQIYLRESSPALPEVPKGWTMRYTTDLTDPVWFYLRGEEYSAQIDYFAQSISIGRIDGENNFASALESDRIVAMILGEATPVASTRAAISRPSVLGRLCRRVLR
jgi:predicted dehydrogenase